MVLFKARRHSGAPRFRRAGVAVFSAAALTAAAVPLLNGGSANATTDPVFTSALAAKVHGNSWVPATLTVRKALANGTVTIKSTWCNESGKTCGNTPVQRYDSTAQAWVNVIDPPRTSSSTGSFTLRTSSSSATTVKLRVSALGGNKGHLTLQSTLSDNQGHTYQAPTLTATSYTPVVQGAGWSASTALSSTTPREFMLTVRNDTDWTFPRVRDYVYFLPQDQGWSEGDKATKLHLEVYQGGLFREIPLESMLDEENNPVLNLGGQYAGLDLTYGPQPLGAHTYRTYRVRLRVDPGWPTTAGNVVFGGYSVQQNPEPYEEWGYHPWAQNTKYQRPLLPSGS